MEATSIRRYGTREEVANDQALMTKGRLTKDMLVLDEKTGRYKSMNMVNNGKRLAEQKRVKAAETPVQERPSVQQEVSKIEQRLASVDVSPVESSVEPKKTSKAKKATARASA
jgi:hypothetical protein